MRVPGGLHCGFFLFDACIGIVILAMFGWVLALWQNTLNKAEKEIIDRVKIIMRARSLLEEYKACGKTPAKKEGFGITWQSTPECVSVTVRSALGVCTLKTGITHAKWDKSA